MQNFRLSFLMIILSVYAFTIYAQPSVMYDSSLRKLQSVIAVFPDNQSWDIVSIRVEGNKITKNYIVRRELPFREGTRISRGTLIPVFDQARYNLMNTNLFLEAILGIDSINERGLYLRISLKERWYIFPLPYFKLIDRNANQWFYEQNADLNRVNYGIKFVWENFSGRRDQIRFNVINGYNQELKFYYEKPYSGKKLEHGYFVGAGYSRQRQLFYATERHKQLFYPANVNTDIPFVKSGHYYEIGYTYRKGVNYRHSLRLKYQQEEIADTIRIILASNTKGYRPYFPGNKGSLNFWQAGYNFQYLNLNNNAYPWKGMAMTAGILHYGFGLSDLHSWGFNARVAKYVTLGEKNSMGLYGFGLITLPYDQPMFNLTSLGFGDVFMRGLEYYVIDCVAGGILKTTFRRELLNMNIPTFLTKSEKYKKIPFKVIAKVFTDVGAAHNPYANRGVFNNTLIYTYGVGVDILGYYDFVAQFDLSANQLGEKGLFLHLRQEF
jgi:outer membrane protein assembly factor BamA